jgi:polysaccharide pyruvyl transferase WcaK-like protein
MDAVDAECGEALLYEIPTIRPSYVREHYRNRTRAVGILPWNLSLKMFGLPTYRSVMRTDLTLLFDAILFDRSLYNPLFNFMSTLYLLLPRAKRRGKKVGCFNVGTGPVDTEHGRKMLRTLSELMDFITVRDQDSLDLLREIGVRNPKILLCADAALTVRAADDRRASAILRQVGLDPDAEILGININAYIDTWARPRRKPMGKEKFLGVYAEALQRLAPEIDAPILFVVTQHHDVEITRQLIARLDWPHPVAMLSNVEFNHYDVKGALRKVSLLVGMRLHSIILASSERTPSLGLAYQPKVEYYLNSLGLADCCLSFQDFDVDALAEHVARGWRRKAELRSHLETAIPQLIRRANRAAELVAALHRGEDLDAVFSRLAAAG